MQRRLDKLSVTPMLGFTVAGCSDFTSVVDPGNGTELLDEGCHGEAVGAFTTVIETDPPRAATHTMHWITRCPTFRSESATRPKSCKR